MKILKFILRFILILVLLIALFIGGFVGYSTIRNGWGIKGLLQTVVGQTDEDIQNLEEFKVLILGISEDISAALTDTIMVASYNPKTQNAVLLSIPRDTFIGDSKYRTSSYDKINAVFQKEGAEGVIDKVNELTGLDIENYIVISNNALVELVDEIGGVEFDVPIDMNYTSKKQGLKINLKKGNQVLNGEQAEELVRFRKNNNGTGYSSEYGGDDFGRMRTQRDFIKAVAKQTLQAKNITKIGKIIDIVKKNVTTNIKDWEAIKNYIPSAVEFNMEDLQTETIPGVAQRIPANTGLWFFLVDEEGTKELVETLYEEEETEETVDTADTNSTDSNVTSSSTDESNKNKEKSEINIEILNGSGDKVLLTKATKALKEEGYTVYKTGTTTKTKKTTIVNKTDVDSDITKDLKSVLGTGVVSNSSTNSSDVDITIVLGSDYEG